MTTRFTKISIGNKALGLENIPGPFFALHMVFFSSYTVSIYTYFAMRAGGVSAFSVRR
ncbi:MAG: hypothetical protein JWL77_6196 [Chthonomonadaceae bacterium]|nr:hypothetical protein [Chthonomonadaceae bacterium]